MDINSIEAALFRAMLDEWTEGANVVVASAVGKLPKSGPVQPAHLDKVKAALIKPFGWPSPGLVQLVSTSVEDIYRLAMRAILRRAMGVPGYKGQAMVYKADKRLAIEPSFSTVDQQAVDSIRESQLFWLKDHYDADTLEAIRGSGLDEILGSEGKDAALIVKAHADKAFGVGKFKAARGYFEAVAVNAATTSRVVASVMEMDKIGVTHYEIMNPMDERTSEICRFMNGKVIEVRTAVEMVNDLLAANTPDEVKAIHPWHNNLADALKGAAVGVSGAKLTNQAGIREAGLALPPYHGRCRSTVDIWTDTEYVERAGDTPEAILSQLLADL